MSTPTGAATPRPSLFWRLLPSYLLVIAVAVAVTFLAGEAFAPFFLQHHVNAMIRDMNEMMQGMDLRASAPGLAATTEDLSVAYRRALTQSLAWAGIAATIAAGAVGLFVTNRIVQPLRAMRRASYDIAAGQYEGRLDDRAPGEVGDLATAFNTMADKLERTEERRVALLADVAHEFRTPLSNLRGYIEGIQDGVFSAADSTTLLACNRQIQRLQRLVDDLSLLSRVETGTLSLTTYRMDARTIVANNASAFRPAFAEKGVALAVSVPNRPVWVQADPERSEQALANLLQNALRHTPAAGAVTLMLAGPDDEKRRSSALIRVSDTGTGVAPDDLPNVFTRFYRGHDGPRSDGGSGIGLTIAKHLVERQGGTIGVNNNSGEGASFWFTLLLDHPDF